MRKKGHLAKEGWRLAQMRLISEAHRLVLSKESPLWLRAVDKPRRQQEQYALRPPRQKSRRSRRSRIGKMQGRIFSVVR